MTVLPTIIRRISHPVNLAAKERLLSNTTLLYLSLPYLIFILGWLHVYLAVPLGLSFCFAVYRAITGYCNYVFLSIYRR